MTRDKSWRARTIKVINESLNRANQKQLDKILFEIGDILGLRKG